MQFFCISWFALSTYFPETFTKNCVKSLNSLKHQKDTEIIIRDDGPGFPADLIDKHRLGEPYIRTKDSTHTSKYGLGLGTFIGKTLLEKNSATITFTAQNNPPNCPTSIRPAMIPSIIPAYSVAWKKSISSSPSISEINIVTTQSS